MFAPEAAHLRSVVSPVHPQPPALPQQVDSGPALLLEVRKDVGPCVVCDTPMLYSFVMWFLVINLFMTLCVDITDLDEFLRDPIKDSPPNADVKVDLGSTGKPAPIGGVDFSQAKNMFMAMSGMRGVCVNVWCLTLSRCLGRSLIVFSRVTYKLDVTVFFPPMWAVWLLVCFAFFALHYFNLSVFRACVCIS
jgi:hypothetical protein